MLNLAYYVSGHGFGHAVRSVEVMRRLAGRCPGIRIHVRTTAAAEIFHPLAECVRLWHVNVDSGAVERSPLEVDVQATLGRIRELFENHRAIVAAEVDYLRTHGIDMIVGDIPYLAGRIAETAGKPCVLVGNFTWDWIYEPYFTAARAKELEEFVNRSYAGAVTLLRLPFSHAVDNIAQVIDVPLIARRSERTRAAIRRQLSLETETRPLILAGMRGGLPRALLDRVAAENRDMVIFTLQDPSLPHRQNLRFVSTSEGLTFPELLRASDVVVSKLGYGVVSEAIANHTRLLWPARSNFREDDILGHAARRSMPSHEIPRLDFESGAWRPHLQQLLGLKVATNIPDTNGDDICALHILHAAGVP